jgi:hypothetical protein
MNDNMGHRPTSLDDLRMFILDVLRHDQIEQVPSILNMLNNDGCIGWRDCWPHDFTAEEVIPALERLISEGSIEALREDKSGNEVIPVPVENPDVQQEVDTMWFALTPKGRARWNEWKPPKEYP